MHSILLLGGTFDPIHNGHIKTLSFIQKKIQFDEVLLMPCKAPVLKQMNQASANQRLSMLKIALENHPTWKICTLEIEREGPSYMVHSLEALRESYPKQTTITLLMGKDAFNTLPQWHQWEKILCLANILVMERQGIFSQQLNIKEQLKSHFVKTAKHLKLVPYGKIATINAGIYCISSTMIRQKIKEKSNISQWIPNEIADYIKQQGLYL